MRSSKAANKQSDQVQTHRERVVRKFREIEVKPNEICHFKIINPKCVQYVELSFGVEQPLPSAMARAQLKQ